MKTITLPADVEHLYLSEVAELIAFALWPDSEKHYKSALEMLGPELEQAALDGSLVTINPLTLQPIPPVTPTDDPLDRLLSTTYTPPPDLRIVSVPDLATYVAARGIALVICEPEQTPKTHAPLHVVFGAPPSLTSVGLDGNPVFDSDGYAQYLTAKSARNAQGRYTVAEAAQVLANAHGLEPAAFIERRMLPAIAANSLKVIDPADGGPLRGRKCNVYADEVTPAGIDAWLSAEGFAEHVRWPEPAAISTAPDTTKQPELTQPLTTNEIAQLFDGIAFAQDRWVKNIGQAKWLVSANRGKGEQGGAPATWCPLTIAQLVYAREKDARAKQKTLASLNSRFRTNPVLKPWKDAWDDYYGMFTEPGEA